MSAVQPIDDDPPPAPVIRRSIIPFFTPSLVTRAPCASLLCSARSGGHRKPLGGMALALPKRGAQPGDGLGCAQGRGRDIPRHCRLGTESDARHYPGVQRCLPKWPGRYFDGGVSDIPETYIIDRQGRLVARFVGPITVEQLTQTVRSISS